MRKNQSSTEKKGFAAYEEINALARSVYGPNVSTVSAIMGDDYEILIDRQLLHQGTSADVRAELLAFGTSSVAVAS